MKSSLIKNKINLWSVKVCPRIVRIQLANTQWTSDWSLFLKEYF